MATILAFSTYSSLKHDLPHTSLTRKSLAVLNTVQKMKVPYDLKQGQSRLFHKLPSDLSMEVIVQKRAEKDNSPEINSRRIEGGPPLVFVHGSYHAAWCWAEHWLPFFSRHGFDCYALSLLAQGESDVPSGPVAGTLQTHAADIGDFIGKNLVKQPVLLGHSFGGLIVQYYLTNIRNKQYKDISFPELDAAVLVCSVPPTGNSGLVWRYLFTKPIAAFKVTRSLAAKAFQTSLTLCKETFFSAPMEDHLVERYQGLMKESSQMALFDLRKLNASLPVPSIPESSIQLLVLGASDDFIVDAQGLEETAKFYGVSAVSVEGIAHDIMLDYSWEKGAQVILSWLETEVSSRGK